MTTEQQRIALAEWDSHEWQHRKSINAWAWFNKAKQQISAWFHSDTKTHEEALAKLPNYTTDLNAVHELEERLDENQRERMMETLHDSRREEWKQLSIKTTEAFEWMICHATAAQRCEALCRVLWPERWQ